MDTFRTIFAALAAATAVAFAGLAAQDPQPPAEETPEPVTQDDARPQKMAWPRDRERVVCRVAGKAHTLEDMMRHIDARHYPGMLKLLETPTGQAYFEHPIMASWVRQYADVVALEATARARGIAYEDAKETLGDTLKKSFEAYLEDYVARREREGRPVELTQDRINLLLTDYQRDRGLGIEVQGWLDHLVPNVPLDATARLRKFYEDHPQYFGGVVTISQILIKHRDPRTLELKTGKALEDAYAKLADVRARLKPDGSNFEAVARRFSDDRRTGREGGRMDGIRRFDERLPAALCRTAWKLADGEISEPFESPFGIHIVKRIGYRHQYYIIFNDQIRAAVSDAMRKKGQEDTLFGAREKYGVELRY